MFLLSSLNLLSISLKHWINHLSVNFCLSLRCVTEQGGIGTSILFGVMAIRRLQCEDFVAGEEHPQITPITQISKPEEYLRQSGSVQLVFTKEPSSDSF